MKIIRIITCSITITVWVCILYISLFNIGSEKFELFRTIAGFFTVPVLIFLTYLMVIILRENSSDKINPDNELDNYFIDINNKNQKKAKKNGDWLIIIKDGTDDYEKDNNTKNYNKKSDMVRK